MNTNNTLDLGTIRHSCAHLLAQTVQRTIDPKAQFGTGPDTNTGFYYDIHFSQGIDFGKKDIKELNKNLKQIMKEPQTFVKYTCALDEGYEINNLTSQGFKNELLDKFKAGGETQISYYLCVVPLATFSNMRNDKPGYKDMYLRVSEYFIKKGIINDNQTIVFLDLCAGPHVENTQKDIDPNGVKIEKLAGAYRQADENNAMMTRIYGLAFENKEALKTYEIMIEEAKKRDHRVRGKKLKLFTLSPLVGAGLPLLQPNGMIMRTEIISYLRELHKNKGYQKIRSPHVAKEDLYKTSGHYDKFGDELFRVQGKEDKFFMKPMNCPHHMQIFADNQFSYRDMPVRYFEPATVYRDEKSGQLSGLTRVRSITQDDGHLFCRTSQIKEEVSTIVDIIKSFYGTLGMLDDYRVSLSIKGYDGKMYLGSDEVWKTAENSLQEAADANNLPYKIIPGEAAFYGPKLDFMFKDAIGRERQLATIQCDFNLPERFDLHFTNETGEKERPVVIHRAIAGSIERFMGVMIEHFAGAFPLWLAPTQVIILPVADTFISYAKQVQKSLLANDIRVKVDTSGDSLNKQIRNAEKMKIPYILVVGEKEEKGNTVNVREYRSKEQYEMDTEKFKEKIYIEYKTRSLQ